MAYPLRPTIGAGRTGVTMQRQSTGKSLEMRDTDREAVQVNVEHWNELVPIHGRSDFYDVAGFKAGKSTLTPIEVEKIGDVAGKSLLHLQCHFGLDTMSWARLGAKATGVDFSDPAIALDRLLSDELAIDVRFVHPNVYDLSA